MACKSPSAATWRREAPNWEDAYLAAELKRAWTNVLARTRTYDRHSYHDWCSFRAATLREARKRGFDISITGLGT